MEEELKVNIIFQRHGFTFKLDKTLRILVVVCWFCKQPKIYHHNFHKITTFKSILIYLTHTYIHKYIQTHKQEVYSMFCTLLSILFFLSIFLVSFPCPPFSLVEFNFVIVIPYYIYLSILSRFYSYKNTNKLYQTQKLINEWNQIKF